VRPGHGEHAAGTGNDQVERVLADDKENARLIILGIIVDALSGLKRSTPHSDTKQRRELRAIRKALEK